MDIDLDIRKSLEENAATYFEKAKKAKRKLQGAKEQIEKTKAKIAVLEDQVLLAKADAAQKQEKALRARAWYEKFRWCVSGDGFLLVGGRDATTNEIIVKKHADKNDLVFHTEAPGSPFVVIKNPEGKDIPESSKVQAAMLCGIFSKAWKNNLRTMDVFMVKPEQVTKEAKSGEYMQKGSFMIYGERTFFSVELKPAILVEGDRVMCGPLSAIKDYAQHHDLPFLELVQGEEKLSNVAKEIKKRLGGEIDDIVRSLPQNIGVKKEKKR